MKKEIWNNIPNINGYQASSLGRIKSKARIINRWRDGVDNSFPIKETILKIAINKFGYETTQLPNKTWLVHRLVALSFIPNPENKRTINHKDGNKLNNVIENLEWNTHSENIKHAFRIGLKIPSQLGKSGKLHLRSKPLISIQDTAIIEHESRSLCAKYFNVHVKAINVALNSGGNCKGHKLYSL